MIAERRREEHEKENRENVREDREEGENIGDVLNDGGHGVLCRQVTAGFFAKAFQAFGRRSSREPSGNCQVGYSCILLSMQTCVCPEASGSEHSTYGRYCAEFPNSFFWSWQCGHQNAPKNVVLVFAMHFANTSYFPFGGGMVFM